MTLYIDGFFPKILTVVAHYLEDQPRSTLTFENSVQYACNKGE